VTLSDLSGLAERSEANAYGQLVEGAPSSLRSAHGLSVHRVGGAQAFVATDVAGSLMLNRVIGLGVAAPASEAQLREIEALYREQRVHTHAIELSPYAQPTDIAARLHALGYLPFKQTTMMVRAVGGMPAAGCGYAVRRVGPNAATAFASLACRVFSLEQPFQRLLEASFDNSCWQHWMAFDGGQPVATAMTCLDGEVAWIGWVATVPEYRGRGIQSAVTAAQMQAAEQAGARWATLETALTARRQPGPSQRNYLRLGWAALYNRIVYLRRPN